MGSLHLILLIWVNLSIGCKKDTALELTQNESFKILEEQIELKVLDSMFLNATCKKCLPPDNSTGVTKIECLEMMENQTEYSSLQMKNEEITKQFKVIKKVRPSSIFQINININ